MRITIILGPFLPVPTVLGGAVEKVHLLLAGAYRAAGHDVTIISRRYEDFQHEEIVEGVRHLRVPSADRSSSLAVNLVRDLRYALRAARALPPSDITITNSFWLPLVLPRERAGKICVQVGRYPKGQMALYHRADRLQAVSSVVAQAIARQTPWLAHKVAVIGYAVPDAYFGREAAPRRERTILFVGRIAREKGIELLLRAFINLASNREANVSDWKLQIVGPHEISQGGDGPSYLDELKSLALPLGAQCAFFGPVFNQEALIRHYQGSAIFVYPSLAETGEALPLAPLEAMAAGCATIVSDLRCFDDYIEHGATGLRFDHRTQNAETNLAAQLMYLMTKEVALVKIAQAGHRAARKFQVTEIASRMLSDFSSLQANRPQ